MAGDDRWKEQFREVYDRAVRAYRDDGGRCAAECVGEADREFLATIGCTAQELYDFVEDFCVADEPSYEDVLEVTAIRRDYFMDVLRGRRFPPRPSRLFPAKSAEVDGIAWLPRLIVKAKAKLRGELPPELMYGCGGDRPFLRGMRVTLAGFLAAVRDAGDDDRRVVEWIKRQRDGGR